MRKSISLKKCSTCKQLKPRNKDMFPKDIATRDGYRCICKECCKITRKLRYEKNGPHKSTEARFKSIIGVAKYRKLEWTLTFDQWSNLVIGPDKKCTYCKGPLPQTSISLDRKDSSLGYTLDNVTPCCKACNEFKMDWFSYDEMVAVVELLEKLRGKPFKAIEHRLKMVQIPNPSDTQMGSQLIT